MTWQRLAEAVALNLVAAIVVAYLVRHSPELRRLVDPD